MRAVLLVAVTTALVIGAGLASADPLQISVATAAVSRDPGGSSGLSIVLSADSAAAFAVLTAANVGNTIDIRIDGETVLSAVLRDPIPGGEIRISGGFGLAELATLAARLQAGTARIEADVRKP